MVTKPINLFYSYAEEDEKLRIKLERHLSQLKRQGKIAPWHFRKITGGKDWKDEISQNLKEAKIILLLVSASFLDSDYCYDIEMDLAMKLHHSNSARVIPVILRSCDWEETPLGNLQALPKNGKPIIKWSDLDDAFLNVVQGIKGDVGCQ
jgi:TIR domain